MKKLFFSSMALLAICSPALAVNSMLKSPVTAAIPSTVTLSKLSIAT